MWGAVLLLLCTISTALSSGCNHTVSISTDSSVWSLSSGSVTLSSSSMASSNASDLCDGAVLTLEFGALEGSYTVFVDSVILSSSTVATSTMVFQLGDDTQDTHMCHDITVTVTPDEHPGETSWELFSTSMTTIATGEYSIGLDQSIVGVCDDISSLSISITDSAADGFDGDLSVKVDGQEVWVFSRGFPGDGVEYSFASDGSQCSNPHSISINFELDPFPEDTSAELYFGHELLASVSYNTSASDLEIFIEYACEGDYSLHIFDAPGDGWAGVYSIQVDGDGFYVGNGFSSGTVEEHEFCIGDSCPDPEWNLTLVIGICVVVLLSCGVIPLLVYCNVLPNPFVVKRKVRQPIAVVVKYPSVQIPESSFTSQLGSPKNLPPVQQYRGSSVVGTSIARSTSQDRNLR